MPNKMLDKRLQVFYKVAQLLSFTKAAELLRMTQPAVTFQIRKLEEMLNVRLFDRSHNQIKLTSAGDIVFEYSERIIKMYDEMINSISETTNSVAGTLKMGATHSVSDYLLPGLLSAYKKNYPEVRINLKVDDSNSIASMVENSFIDVGLVDLPITTRSLKVTNVACNQMVVIFSRHHEWNNLEYITPQQLIEQPILLYEEGEGSRKILEHYLQQHNIDKNDLKIIMELGSTEAIKSGVESGIGVAILPRNSVDRDIKAQSVTALPLRPKLENYLSLVYKEQKYPLKVLDELVKFIRNYYVSSVWNEQDGKSAMPNNMENMG